MIIPYDIKFEDVLAEKYDLAIFGCGYEARCVHAAKLLNKSKIRSSTICAFDNIDRGRQRLENDKYFTKNWNKFSLKMNANDDSLLLTELQAYFSHKRKGVKILIDYSSMSRIWYTALLNWARFTENVDNITVDFIYSVGANEGDLPFYAVKNILPLPGCEGGALRFGDAIAVFGLGMYGLMAQSAFENIEPDLVYSYMASPGNFPGYTDQVKKNNKFILDHTIENLEAPLSSVQTTFRYLSDFIAPHLEVGEIVLIPMGPKPHVLSAIILSLTYKEAACLRVNADRQRAEVVKPTGEIIATRVIFY